MYKNPPFNKFRDTIEKINAIIDERYAIDFPAHADPMVVAVLKSCLDRNPRNRPTIEELLSHPYLTCTDTSASKSPKLKGFSELKSQLEPFMEGGKLSDTAKVYIYLKFIFLNICIIFSCKNSFDKILGLDPSMDVKNCRQVFLRNMKWVIKCNVLKYSIYI